MYPMQVVVSSFALVIGAGTALLSLPFATKTGTRMPLVDAFFTAVSATCVTGLTVVDTGTYFSTFGQLVVLACVQIGGLGLMTLTTVFVVLMGARLAIPDRIAIQQLFLHTPTNNIRKLITYIVLATFLVEAVGAVIFSVAWTLQGRFDSVGETVYRSVFHSITSFCNAGFSLDQDSIHRFYDDPVTLVVTSLLIIVGGLGFLVGLDLKSFVQQRFLRFRAKTRNVDPARLPRRPRLSVHSKFVLITGFALIVIGTLSYYIIERNGVFADMPAGTAWLNAYFSSVTTRSAGFSTVDFGGMSGAALLCTMVLMLIGGGPGSTAGGVKTSTFGLLIAFSISRWKGHKHLNAFGRTIPQLSIDRAAGVVIAISVLFVLGSSVLMATETYDLTSRESQNSFLSVMFETASAIGTTGLTMGRTAELGAASKLVCCLLMFLGRVGPLTLALAISRREKRVQFRYAEENIMIG